MKTRIIFSLFLAGFLLVSCESKRPNKLNATPTEVKPDSSAIINVKPLSTEKTHEGGVDQTQPVFNKK